MVDLIIDSSSAAIKTHIENTKNRKIWNTQNRENVTIVSKLNIATFLTVTCVKRIFFWEGRCINRQSLSAKPPSKLDAERKEPGQFIERADPPGAFAQLLLIEIQG